MEANQFSDDKAAHLRNLIAVHTRRLQRLEITAATYGIDTPPHILIELDDLTEKIRNLEAEILKLSEQGQQEDGALKVIDDVTQQLTSDQIREFITFTEGKVTIVPESFRRHSSYHNHILRELRRQKLIRPFEGGNWQPGSHIEVTRFGTMVYERRQDELKRKVTP